MKEHNLTPAELKAIEEHKYFLSQQRGSEVSIDEAIEDFTKHFAAAWAEEKLRRDNQAQRGEIERYKYLRSEAEGRDIGKTVAATEWCQRYAAIWRAERESLDRNGFVRRVITTGNPRELHLRPMSTIGQLATEYDCDIYVHKDNMPYYNFLLAGKSYMNVKSIIGFLSMGLELGDQLEFIATGAQAGHALDAIERLLTGPQPVSETP